MKKRKEEILHSKEQPSEQSTAQSTVQSKEQSTVQSTVKSKEQSTVQSTVQSTIQSDDTYIYDGDILAVLSIGACVFFAYNTSQAKNKKQANDRPAAQHEQKHDQPPKRLPML